VLKVSIRGLLSHKVRLVATTVAVLLGVAFLTGTQVLTASVTRSFERIFDDAYRNVDVVVRSTSQISTPFGPQTDRTPDEVVDVVRVVDGVAVAEGQVDGLVTLIGPDGRPVRRGLGPPVIGWNWMTEPALNGWQLVEGEAPSGTDDVVVDRRTAADADLAVGDTVTVETPAGPRPLDVVGTARFGDSDSFGGTGAVLMTTATAQEVVGEPGKSSWISVRGVDGIGADELRSRIDAVLPDGSEAITREAFVQETQEGFVDIIDLIRQALLVFGYVSLGVGAFIIYNTFSVIVAQRGRELALLRAVGASRSQVGAAVLGESAVVGVVAAAAGVAAGVGLGVGLVRLMIALGFGLTSVPITVRPSNLVFAGALGAVVTMISALLPAWRASRVPPIAALRDVSIDRPGRLALRTVSGLVLVAAGGVGVVRTLVAGGALQLVGAYAVAVFAGMVVLGPVLAPPFVQLIGRPLPALAGISAHLARENAVRSPRRTAATASALMVGVGLVVFIAVAADSVKASTVDVIDRAVRGDLVVTSEGPGPSSLAPAVAEQLAALPEAEAVTTLRVGFAEIDGEGELVLAIDPTTFPELIRADVAAGALDRLGTRGIAVPEAVAADRGWSLGQPVPVTFLQTGSQLLELVATYDNVLPAPGEGYLVTQELFAATYPAVDQTDNAVYVRLDDGVALDDGRAAVEAVTAGYPSARVQDIGQFTQQRLDRVNQFLVVLYALLGLALIIAIVGIVNTLLLSVYERTRELGLLRAVGMSRRQVGSSVCWESVLIAVLGACTGVAIGLFFGWALVQGLADRGASVFSVPTGQLVSVVVLAAASGVAAALYPAWRAGRLDVLQAIATE
jgi:putative ABC transport system permease protein